MGNTLPGLSATAPNGMGAAARPTNRITEMCQDFYETPLGSYPIRGDGSLGLPGVDGVATERLARYGITSACTLFGQYLALGRNRAAFFEYLRTIDVVLEAEPGFDLEGTESLLADLLDKKWQKVSEF